MWRAPAVVGAVLMPVSLFLTWYDIPENVFGGGLVSFEGWEIFEFTDAVMVLAAAVTLFLLLKAPTAGTSLVAVGAIATGSVAVELVNKPTLFALPYIPGMTIEAGAWLGLLGALLVLASGCLNLLLARR
jgi:hypothetical protein